MHSSSLLSVENFIPGKMDELGIGYDTLKKINPRIIFCSISGWGAEGPHAKRAGYDIIAAAEAGLMHITGESDGPPSRPGIALCDLTTALYSHGAILAALRARDLTGVGQKISVSLFESQISLLVNHALAYLNLGQEAQRWGSKHPTIAPYQVSDSFSLKPFTNLKNLGI